MLKIEDFKKFELEKTELINGGGFWSYECGDGTGFSTIGDDMDLNEAVDRCGKSGFTATHHP